ncbi:mas-related G-protein coupled receptor member A4-like [Paramacrobiotus metropolitanus]|uniref:mas-related G-protein coupled receptor member A4-like n=1 Tax=Paramacrobiotus metropolitanus TaxID=2943436 RepID=UPI002445E61F|nr:mas-related G-protein coupled receptor member A4-like [Paramacrobiotus metropolitanus]
MHNHEAFLNFTTNETMLNATNSSRSQPPLGAYDICEITNLILAVLFNSTILLILLHQPREVARNPFLIYVLNLLIANLVFFICYTPLDLAVDDMADFSFGLPACSFYLYAQYCVGNISIFGHLLIVINRIWAVAAPIHYKQHHTVRITTILCGISWIIMHVIIVPGIVFNATLLSKSNMPKGCVVDVINSVILKTWNTFAQMVLVISEIIMLAGCPYILRKKHGTRQIAKSADSDTNDGASYTANKDTVVMKVYKRKADENKETSWLLLLLTLSVFFFWTPSMIWYIKLSFSSIYDPYVTQVINLIFNFQAVVDPIVFTLAFDRIRKYFEYNPCTGVQYFGW